MIVKQRLPAKPASLRVARHATTDALAQAGMVDRELLAAIALAVNETFGNAVRHAYPDALGDVDLIVECDATQISVTVADTGVGINRPPRDPGRGLGIQLIGELTNAWTVDSDGTGTTVCLRFDMNPNHDPPSPEHAVDVHGDPETPV
jgi:anti-sigma regulatory factor (Ser/Thr protein kinase)